MKVRIKVVPVVCLLLVHLCGAGFAESEEEKIAALIERLSSDSYEVREKATKDLWELGLKAKEALEEASLSDDPERALRAADVLRKVELRITPGTSDEVMRLIEAYQGAGMEKKSDILNQLRDLKAYHQMLTLYAMDRPEARASLAQHIRGVAILGAREALINNDKENAIQILVSTAKDAESARALASIYHHEGLRGEELVKLKPDTLSIDEWKLYIKRAEGDLEGMLEAATALGDERVVAGLQVLAGNPIPWLKQNGMGKNRQSAHEEYVTIALKRWNGEQLGERDYAPLLRQFEAGDENEKAMVVSALVMLGRLDAVLDIQLKDNPLDGFIYYLSMEEIDKALASLGLVPENPDYTAWVKKRFNGLDEDDEDGSNSIYELLLMASFLEKRGLFDELDAAFSKRLNALAKDNEGTFLEILGSMLGSSYGASEYAVQQASVWAGDDEVRWSRIFTVALGDDDGDSDWRSWIVEIEPKTSQREILEVVLALTQRSQSHGSLRGEWIDRFWSSIKDQKDPATKTKLINRMLKLAINQQDVLNALKAWDMLDDEQKKKAEWGTIDKFFSAAGRWEDALKVIEKSGLYEKNPLPEMNAYYAVHLRRTGQEEKARIYDDRALMLALGDAYSCLRIASSYSYGGDHKRAAEWYERAVMQAGFQNNEFVGALNSYADAMMKQSNWDVAASCYEALVQVYAAQPFQSSSISLFARERLNADLAKAMSVLKTRPDQSQRLLEGIHKNFITDGVLADDFFPLLRKSGLDNELQRFFAESWKKIETAVKKYPASHNTKNTAAWFASRAGIKVKEAEIMLMEALAVAPEQAAYLDTMAEIKFAQGDREAAIRWSDRAVCFSPYDEMIRLQHERFRNSEVPKQNLRPR